MLILSTRLPLKDDFTKEKCLTLYTEWITKSQHYGISEISYDINSTEDFQIESENSKFYIKRYKDETIELFACRVEQKDKEAIWSTDCVFLQDTNSKSMLIQLNCNSINFKSKLPRAHKPYIIKKIMESNFCKDDANIPVIAKPITINKENLKICANVMRGEYCNSMPVIYLSVQNDDHCTLNPNEIAKKLSGLAHVFVEENKEISWQLKELSNDNNAHNGYVGIYFPQSEYVQRFSIDFYDGDERKMKEDIELCVWKALSNRQEASLYNWNQIITLQTRQKMMHWKNISEGDKEELKRYVQTFDAENERLKEEKEELLKENRKLIYQIDNLKEQLKDSKQGKSFYNKGKEKELYFSEMNDLLFSILNQVKNKYEKNSRAYILICDLIEANPSIGECKKIVEAIKRILKKGSNLTSTDKSELKEVGFNIIEDGAHYKLLFHNDPRYMFTVSRTPSDHREGKNLASDIIKIIDVEKKIY